MRVQWGWGRNVIGWVRERGGAGYWSPLEDAWKSLDFMPEVTQDHRRFCSMADENWRMLWLHGGGLHGRGGTRGRTALEEAERSGSVTMPIQMGTEEGMEKSEQTGDILESIDY